jgi:hypothetical protein
MNAGSFCWSSADWVLVASIVAKNTQNLDFLALECGGAATVQQQCLQQVTIMQNLPTFFKKIIGTITVRRIFFHDNIKHINECLISLILLLLLLPFSLPKSYLFE